MRSNWYKIIVSKLLKYYKLISNFKIVTKQIVSNFCLIKIVVLLNFAVYNQNYATTLSLIPLPNNNKKKLVFFILQCNLNK